MSSVVFSHDIRCCEINSTFKFVILEPANGSQWKDSLSKDSLHMDNWWKGNLSKDSAHGQSVEGQFVEITKFKGYKHYIEKRNFQRLTLPRTKSCNLLKSFNHSNFADIKKLNGCAESNSLVSANAEFLCDVIFKSFTSRGHMICTCYQILDSHKKDGQITRASCRHHCHDAVFLQSVCRHIERSTKSWTPFRTFRDEFCLIVINNERKTSSVCKDPCIMYIEPFYLPTVHLS